MTQLIEKELLEIINETEYLDSRLTRVENKMNGFDTVRAIYVSCINEDGLAPIEAFAWICFAFGFVLTAWGVYSLFTA